MTTITAKIQIYVPAHDVEILESTTCTDRQACNWVNEKIFQTKVLSLANLNNLYYKNLRESFGLKSQMAQSAMRTVVGIDLGVNFLATTYDKHAKTAFFSGKPIKQKRGQYKALCKQLAKKQTSSAS